jgi:type I restriction enzyme, S subunit
MTLSEPNWQVFPLENCIEKLIDYRGKSPKKSEAGIPVLSAKVVKGGRILTPIVQTISPHYYSEWMRRGIPKLGDVVLTTEGPLGEVAQIDDKTYALGQRIVTLRGLPDKLDNTFLKFLLMSSVVQSELYARATGTTVMGISQKALRKVPLKLPPYCEQKSIASVLGALDDKIENNRRINETLEEMARTIFKSWFVDFDPVHAKTAGNVPAHMDAETAALFPSSFGDDGLPAGWKKQDIGLLVEIRKGLSYKGKFLSDGGVGMINLGCFGFRGTFKPEKIKSYTGEFKDRHKVKSGDLIFANTDMTQDRAILCSPVIVPSYIDEGEAIFSHHVSHVHFLEVQQPAFTELLRHFMMTPDFRMRAEGYATGTTVLAVPKNIFDGYHVCVPSNEVLTAFFEFSSVIAKKLEANYTENITLSELRDTLLPKLMSGEIRVADAEREVEATV